jgi:hypothetical protein
MTTREALVVVDERERLGDRPRSPRVVAFVAAAVVVVIASVTVGLAGRGAENAGRDLTIEALAAKTQKQSVRITITETLTGPVDRHAERVVRTGLVDYRTGDGRFESATQSGSAAAKPFATELFVADQRYLRIASWIQGIPERVRRTKKWIYIDVKTASFRSAGLNPFDPFALFKDLHISFKDRGTTKFGGQTVEHYTATKWISSEKVTLSSDVYVDRQGRATHIEVGEKAQRANSTLQIDFSDYGVRVEVTAAPDNEVVRASDLPIGSGPTPTSGRRGALVLRQDIDTSAAQCKTPGALAHTERSGSRPPLCTLLGATIVTGDDVTSADARPKSGSSNRWCVAPTLTADGFAQVHRYAKAYAPFADLFVISRGKFLGEVFIDPTIRNGDCWISTDRMTEAIARGLAEELSGG